MKAEELDYQERKRKQDALVFDGICNSFLKRMRGSRK